MLYSTLLVGGALGVSVANLAVALIAYAPQDFPHLMLSDFITHPRAAPIVQLWWPLYIACHSTVELKMLARVQNSGDPGRRLWERTFGLLVVGWAAMVGCLVFDIHNFPLVHSLLGGAYGGGWLLAQGIRGLWLDEKREALGLAAAPGCARVRWWCALGELATAPFIIAGMQLPHHLCPDWLSVVCVLCEHLLWVHARTVLAVLSHYPDARLLDEARAARPPSPRRSKVSAFAEFCEALTEARKSAKEGVRRRRIGFRQTVLQGM
mmetsp:Transcript_23148/g.69332  ORF Transcript_23148/g.69332 Transcript_23148/m.69332 type:complete len:265 (+) Transcript_23148:220-1014(+)